MPDGSHTQHFQTQGFIPSGRPRPAGSFVATAGRETPKSALFRPLTPAAMVVDRINVPESMIAATLFAAVGKREETAQTTKDEAIGEDCTPVGPQDAPISKQQTQHQPTIDLSRLAAPTRFSTKTWEEGWEEGLKAGREEGLLQGRIEGRDAARAELADAAREQAEQAEALAAALAALDHTDAGHSDDLVEALNRAVLRLASERAGIEIDANPAGLARRITRLADRVGLQRGSVTVHVHPSDHLVLTRMLEKNVNPEFAALAAARLAPDSTLMRGDADLRAPGVRVADLLEEPAALAVAAE